MASKQGHRRWGHRAQQAGGVKTVGQRPWLVIARAVATGHRLACWKEVESSVPTWEYKIESVTIADRWSAKRQAEEVANLEARVNEIGRDGWEMVSYESVPMFGSFSNKLKGYAYLVFFKRLQV